MTKKEIKSNTMQNLVGVDLVSTQNAITLISLIITIIILLILAGVTITMAIGENGIFGLAEKASKNYMDAQEKEENMIAQAENHIYSSRQVSQKEYDELLKERDYLKEELQKSKKIIYLGQGNSFNLKQLQENGKIPSDVDLANISIDNFIVGISSVSSGTTDVVQQSHWSRGWLFGNTISKGYDSTSGKLTISNTIVLRGRAEWSGGSASKDLTISNPTFAYLVY